jgi:iron complex transport system permease protein
MTALALPRRRARDKRETVAVSRLSPAILLPALAILLVVAAVMSIGIGAVGIGVPQIAGILAQHAGIDLGIDFTRQQDAVLWQIRLPRVVMTGAIGGALAVSGATLQGIFRNPLADPSLIGVSSGAATGAVAAIVLGITPFGVRSLPIAAFAGGAAATMLVYTLSRQNGKTDAVTLLLTGIAVNAISGAFTGLMTFVADDEELRTITFWSMGSTGSATWERVAAIAPFLVIGMLLLPRYAAPLNLFALGEREASHLGVDTERVRVVLVTITALLVGASVAVAGIVGFLGLVVPHLIRLISGPNHKTLLPASALGGAALLLFADLISRTIAVPAEIPLGVVTSFIGGPFFLFLLFRTRRNQGNWA